MVSTFMRYRIFPVLLLFSSIWTLSACDNVDSEDIRTSGIYAYFRASADNENQTYIFADLRTGPGLFADKIILSAGDTLKAGMGPVEHTLSRDGNNNYVTTFDINGSDAEVIIGLDRANDTDAPNSRVTLPTGFAITTPGAAHVFNRGEDITITWDPSVSDKNINITIGGTCTASGTSQQLSFSRDVTLSDTGTYASAVDVVMNARGQLDQFDTGKNCPGYIFLERKTDGTLDPNYGKGGSISASLSRRINIEFNP